MKFASYFKVYLLCFYAPKAYCWQYFTRLSDIILSNSPQKPETIHSEYIFGKCKAEERGSYYTQVYIDHLEVLGKVIIRGWLNIKRIPTCIKITGVSYEYDLFRSTAYNFQICVPRITYCHSQRRFKYFYYEWYIPVDLVGGMDWNILFFGPTGFDW